MVSASGAAVGVLPKLARWVSGGGVGDRVGRLEPPAGPTGSRRPPPRGTSRRAPTRSGLARET